MPINAFSPAAIGPAKDWEMGKDRQPHVVLAWEVGAGRTHVVNLLALAERLIAAGCRCTALLYNMMFAHEFRAIGVDVMQAPLWPLQRRGGLRTLHKPVHGMMDALANYGFGDEVAVAAAMGGYDILFDLLRPDLVVGEFAYGARLAARGRVPFVAMGGAVYMPPLGLEVLPPYFADKPLQSWDPEALLAGLNAGLAQSGRAPLDRFAEVIGGDRYFPLCLAALDNYRSLRADGLYPPFLPGYSAELDGADGQDLFVYLHAFVQYMPNVAASLLASPEPMRLFMPGVLAENSALFQMNGSRVEDTPVAVADFARHSRAAVHHGGPQMFTVLAAAGIPQVILANHEDNHITGALVRDQGIGLYCPLEDVTVPWFCDAIEQVMTDDAMRTRARAYAPAIKAELADPMPMIAAACLDLLGRG